MPRPISATIHTQALRHNLARARAAAPGTKAWAVVKANAYGHGLARAFAGLREADGFALLDLDEAVRLRESGWAGPILLLEGFFEPADLDLINRHGLTTGVHCDDQLRMIETARLDRPLNVYLKMNTGMNRLGFRPARYRAAWERARGIASIGQITLMTHFANADGEIGIAAQCEAFEHGAAGIAGERSVANSAATLWHPDAHGDWIRPGVLLYGASPTGRHADIAAADLRPAMTLTSRLIATQRLEAGESIGYGSLFRADQPIRAGIVACGYADGYPRHAPTGTPIAVNGVRTRTLGRVSMDMLAVDLTPCGDVQTGASVELWGEQVAIDDVAQAAGTIGYELMCAVMPRVPTHAD
ncbi:alanine racemase [Chitinasiproducens palmae]|uniref:Alanine racemase n=1 Tax=Chitinasiproducens palmae TaxID=1770053 RepID=A0A1H2PLW1_9BURK|nr:alanine racemase [Chitinasiproducens palmae]SDV47502.1 alanine racemase [Chitinasiproducens palmae]